MSTMFSEGRQLQKWRTLVFLHKLMQVWKIGLCMVTHKQQRLHVDTMRFLSFFVINVIIIIINFYLFHFIKNSLEIQNKRKTFFWYMLYCNIVLFFKTVQNLSSFKNNGTCMRIIQSLTFKRDVLKYKRIIYGIKPFWYTSSEAITRSLYSQSLCSELRTSCRNHHHPHICHKGALIYSRKPEK